MAEKERRLLQRTKTYSDERFVKHLHVDNFVNISTRISILNFHYIYMSQKFLKKIHTFIEIFTSASDSQLFFFLYLDDCSIITINISDGNRTMGNIHVR